MITSSNDGRRVAIHNIIYLNPGYQTPNGLVMKLLATTLSQFCSKVQTQKLRNLGFVPIHLSSVSPEKVPGYRGLQFFCESERL